MKCTKCGQRMIRISADKWACANPRCELYNGKELK